MKKILGCFLTFLFIVGFFACIILGVWFFSLCIYVFDESVTYPGEIAKLSPYVPFLISLLGFLLLWRLPNVQKNTRKVVDIVIEKMEKITNFFE